MALFAAAGPGVHDDAAAASCRRGKPLRRRQAAAAAAARTKQQLAATTTMEARRRDGTPIGLRPSEAPRLFCSVAAWRRRRSRLRRATPTPNRAFYLFQTKTLLKRVQKKPSLCVRVQHGETRYAEFGPPWLFVCNYFVSGSPLRVHCASMAGSSANSIDGLSAIKQTHTHPCALCSLPRLGRLLRKRPRYQGPAGPHSASCICHLDPPPTANCPR